jgi:hypothetical protein
LGWIITKQKGGFMKDAQKKYAMSRIDLVQAQKNAEINEKFTVPAQMLTQEERYKMMVAGRVKPLPLSSQRNYGTLNELLFDFSQFDAKRDEKMIQRLTDEVSRMATKARDMLMLGDAQDALKIIAELERIKIG